MVESGWSICDGTFEAIRTLSGSIDNPIIVEFGSGNGTEKLATLGTVYSVEHNPEWILDFNEVQYIHAPLVNIDPVPSFNHSQWYDANCVFELLPEKYDFILVDGPPGNIGRSGLLYHLNRMPVNCIWVIDDTLRSDESRLADHIALHGSMCHYRFWNFSLLTPAPITKENHEIIKNASIATLQDESAGRIKQFYPGYQISEVIG
jgi:hypothetical protein